MRARSWPVVGTLVAGLIATSLAFGQVGAQPVNDELGVGIPTRTAERSGRPFATNGDACRFRPGLLFTTPEDATPELVLYTLDGDYSDDRRIPLPSSISRAHLPLLARDCNTVVIFATQNRQYHVVDVATGVRRTRTMSDPAFQPVTMLGNGDLITWQNEFEGLNLINLLTGERTLMVEGGLSVGWREAGFSNDGGTFVAIERFGGTGTPTVLVLTPGSAAPDLSFELATLGDTARVDVSQNGEHFLVHGVFGSVAMTRVYSRNGRLIDSVRSNSQHSFLKPDVLVRCDDGTAVLCNADTGEFAGRLRGHGP